MAKKPYVVQHALSAAISRYKVGRKTIRAIEKKIIAGQWTRRLPMESKGDGQRVLIQVCIDDRAYYVIFSEMTQKCITFYYPGWAMYIFGQSAETEHK